MIEQQSTPNIIEQGQITVTDTARLKISELIASAGESIDAVRVFVTGGGCSGMNYGMTFSETNNSLDSILEGSEGFRMVVDPFALSYMHGAEIDYSEDGANATFVFNNVFQAIGGSGSCGGCGGAQ
ncbi:MAG: iron-sulfur cluster assembly accessory protein [Acidiferrobacteraceae bacterium]|nr:iron-sulfur cluster assembly accessory protein [Acidiferrobacteraceae bacterium]|tara:strand:+ start:114 stop:491 length:378 start_codon:yes stop_codon:yes gene_type:complete